MIYTDNGLIFVKSSCLDQLYEMCVSVNVSIRLLLSKNAITQSISIYNTVNRKIS